MIFASDLDRTLIYSVRFLEEYPYSGPLIKVDDYKISSYMSGYAVELFKVALSYHKFQFVPVTSRSEAQYKRIRFPFEEPNLAITSCGSKVLYQGNEMPEWTYYVQKHFDPKELNVVLKKVKELPGLCREPTLVDGRVIFAKIDMKDRLAVHAVNGFEQNLSGYRVHLEKDKLYVIPSCFGKDAALFWLSDKLNENNIFTAGDSIQDLCMASISSKFAMAGHHSIPNLQFNPHKGILTTSGVKASEEILLYAIQIFLKNISVNSFENYITQTLNI